MVDLRSKFTGALIGSAVGDALGAPVEGWSMEMVRSRYREGTGWTMINGRYTDDTELMIGVAESLIEHKGFNGADMARRFIQNYDATRGYSPWTQETLQRIREGVRWDKASENLFGGKGSYGNGAAMRVAPIGLLYYDDADTLRDVAYKSSSITHAHELGKEGAALQAFSIALAVRGEKEGMVPELQEFARSEVYKKKLGKIAVLLQKERTEREIIAELGNGEAAFNSVPTALYSFLRFDTFEASVVYAVGLGGDTDTIGAMTGAIGGAYYGEGGIPNQWVERLEEGARGMSYIKRLAEELYHLKKSDCNFMSAQRYTF
ncbi:MAG: hypothetical protein EFT35_05565 [Methanophagales archaeon ANME-1-THS]|nr:MAG: hypothetical protein EFT35_05565 [Methanophagales archaeon ANME-1-THS]